MYKWNYIQTKTELEFIFDILKEQIKGLKVKRIFSFENTVPKKVGEKIIYNTLDEPLYILFDISSQSFIVAIYDFLNIGLLHALPVL